MRYASPLDFHKRSFIDDAFSVAENLFHDVWTLTEVVVHGDERSPSAVVVNEHVD